MSSFTKNYTNVSAEVESAMGTNKVPKYETTEETAIDLLELFGPTNPYFNLIHYTALVCLTFSIIISFYTVVNLLRNEKGSVFNWKVGKCCKCHFYTK